MTNQIQLRKYSNTELRAHHSAVCVFTFRLNLRGYLRANSQHINAISLVVILLSTWANILALIYVPDCTFEFANTFSHRNPEMQQLALVSCHDDERALSRSNINGLKLVHTVWRREGSRTEADGAAVCYCEASQSLQQSRIIW